MKKGVWVTFTLSLLAMTALTGTSSQSIRVLPGPVKVKQGNNVTLWCELKNDPGSKVNVPVHWQSPPKFKTRTSDCDSFIKEKYSISCGGRWYNMTVVDVQWDDKGKYRCVHTSHIGVVDLQVLVPVTDVSLAYVSKSTAEPQSKNAELTCTTNCAYPAPNISWWENDQLFKGNPINIKTEKIGCTADKDGQKWTRSTLTIKVESVKPKKKQPKMSCSAENSRNGEKKFSKAIDTLTGTSSQSIRVPPGPVEVKRGNNVTLWCELKNDSELKVPVHWQTPPSFKTRTMNCDTFAKEKYVISCEESRSKRGIVARGWYNLTIIDVQWADRGKYRCISTKLEIVELQVFVPVTSVTLTHVPSSKKELLLLGKDTNAVLTCTTNCANPAPSISWFEKDKPFSGSAERTMSTEKGCTGEKKGQKRTVSTLKVIGKYEGEEKNQSNISCTAGRVKGERKVSRTVNVTYNVWTGVRFQNTSKFLSGPVKVKQGNNVSLWCKLIDDSAKEPVHWQSPPKFTTRTSNCDTFGPSENQKYVMSCAESRDRSYNMTVMDVQWADKGKYRCIHTRHLGIVELEVLVPVTNVSLTNVSRSNKKSGAELTCTTNCAYPAPIISWFENDQPFNGSAVVTITESGCTGDKEGQKKTISKVIVTGKYMGQERKEAISCTAENIHGKKISSNAVVIANGMHEISKPPQPQHVMAIGDIVAVSVLVPVLVVMIAVSVRVIVINVRRYRKKKNDMKKDEEEHIALLERGALKKRGCSIIYEYDDTLATHEKSVAFLGDLRDAIQKHGFGVELREVKQSGDGPVSKVLKELGQEPRSKKVILSLLEDNNNKRKFPFSRDKFREHQLHKTFNEIMQEGEQSFVAVIIQAEKFAPELQWIEKRWNEKKRQTQWFGSAKCHLQLLQDETINQVNFALMNLGTGLAWSYYLGYLTHILSVFKKTYLTSSRQNQYRDIPGNRLAKQIYIVFTTNCQQPKIMNSERIKQKLKIKDVIARAGLGRDYFLPIQEVKSKDEKESYFGVVCFLSAVQCLSKMKDDPDKEFFRFDEDDMRTHGQDCFEKLKLVIKYNEKIKEDQSKFDFIEFNTETANADENDLADDLFNRMKEACSFETISPTEEVRATDAYQTGVLSGPISEDIKEFVDNLENSIKISNFPHVNGRSEFGLSIIRESKRIFMVLTDDLVKSDAFAKWFYVILDRGFQINDKRFLVCLNCLNKNADHPKVLELEQLFCCVGYIKGWADKVKSELEGNVEEIRHEQLFHNIGTGLAMSWYYNFLKIKIPKVRDVIDKCPFLMEKFQEGRMSHKVFFLFPSSCFCPEKVHCGDIIKEVYGKDIKLPHIMKDNRDYTPRVYSLKDEGKEYYAFVEYIAPADIMFNMMKCTDTVHPQMQSYIIQEESNRFYTKLLTLINHKDEPMDINNRIYFIPYDDTKYKDQQLECMLLDHVEEQIHQMVERVLPRAIDNGATIEFPHS